MTEPRYVRLKFRILRHLNEMQSFFNAIFKQQRTTFVITGTRKISTIIVAFKIINTEIYQGIRFRYFIQHKIILEF